VNGEGGKERNISSLMKEKIKKAASLFMKKEKGGREGASFSCAR